MSRPYEVLEHTADVGLRARGRTLEEVFTNMALGMLALVVAEPGRISGREQRRVAAGAEDLEGLLVAWLSEFVYLVDAEGFLVARIEGARITGRAAAIDETGATDRTGGGDAESAMWTVSAVVHGERIDPTRHQMELEIKGVSYHLVKVGRSDVAGEPGGGWVAQAIFDV